MLGLDANVLYRCLLIIPSSSLISPNTTMSTVSTPQLEETDPRAVGERPAAVHSGDASNAVTAPVSSIMMVPLLGVLDAHVAGYDWARETQHRRENEDNR